MIARPAADDCEPLHIRDVPTGTCSTSIGNRAPTLGSGDATLSQSDPLQKQTCSRPCRPTSFLMSSSMPANAFSTRSPGQLDARLRRLAEALTGLYAERDEVSGLRWFAQARARRGCKRPCCDQSKSWSAMPSSMAFMPDLSGPFGWTSPPARGVPGSSSPMMAAIWGIDRRTAKACSSCPALIAPFGGKLALRTANGVAAEVFLPPASDARHATLVAQTL